MALLDAPLYARHRHRAEPAAVAAQRAFGAWALLSLAGVLWVAFVGLRVVETWHVTPHNASHTIRLLGWELGYPTANAAAVVLVAFAGLGLVVAGLAAWGLTREARTARRFHRGVRLASDRSLPGTRVIEDPRPLAFCAGLLRPRVYVSTGALDRLDAAALAAVLAHERHHAARFDPLRLAVGRVLRRALFFVPGLGALVDEQQTLAELSADEHAAGASAAGRAALAGAMLCFAAAGEPGAPIGIEAARVDRLLGEAPGWAFPAAVFGGGAVVLAAVLAAAVLAGQVAYGSATLAPPFLSRQPCVVVLAALPAVLAVWTAAGVRLRRRRRHRG